MSWNQGGGGPWGGPPGGGQNPWGGRDSRRGPDGPDIDELVRQMQMRFRRLIPGGGHGPVGVGLLALLFLFVLVVLQGFAQGTVLGFYRVNDGELAVIQRFGAVVRQEQPGLRWLIPVVEKYTAVSTTRALTLQVTGTGGRPGDEAVTNRMVTRDLNLIEMDFTVQWRVRDPEDFLFKLRDPEGTLRLAAESVVREYIGRSTFDEIIPPEQNEILNPITVQADGTTTEVPAATEAPVTVPQLASLKSQMQDRLQKLLDEYDSGIYITDLQLTRPVVPAAVKSAYDGVQQAGNDAKSNINRAVVDANATLANARGEADSIRLQASAYKTQVTEAARGEADRFSQVLSAYSGAKEITTTRLYLETMEQVLGPANKVVLGNGDNAALPYLPLDLMRRTPSTQPALPSGGNAP